MSDTHAARAKHRWRALLAQCQALLPSQCAICHAWPAERLCRTCLQRFAPAHQRCQTCACVLYGTAQRCGDCTHHPPLLHQCLAAVDYGYPWSRLIGQFKFHADPGWATSLASLLRSTPGAAPALARADLVLPVPLATERLRQRGYNQSLLLARACAGSTVSSQLLLRVRDTPAQSQLPRAQRLRNLHSAFAVEPLQTQAVAGKNILLIDDVMTTGATLNAAAQPLLHAGAASVSALVLARTPG